MIYSNSAFGPPFNAVKTLTSSSPNYLFGERKIQEQPALFTITSVSLSNNVASVGVVLKSGGPSLTSIPQVGSKMGVQGAANTQFNIDPTTVQSITYDSLNGVGVVSYALEGADVAQTPDVGQLVIQSAEIADIGIVTGSTSRALALSFNGDEEDSARSAFVEAKWVGTLPTSATVCIEGANVNDDPRYAIVQNAYGVSPSGSVAASDAAASITGGAVSQSGANYQYLICRFIRARVTAIEGNDDTTGLILTISA